MTMGKNTLARILLLVLILSLLMPAPGAFAVPAIVVSSPSDNSVVSTSSVNVSGYVTDTVSLRINGTSIPFGSNGFFSYTVTNLTAGSNNIIITAVNSSGITTNKYLPVVYDSGAAIPLITITSPADTYDSPSLTVPVTGTVLNYDTVTISVNGTVSPVIPDGSGNFTSTANLSPGDNTVVVTANKSGVVATKTLRIRYNNPGSVIANVCVNSQPVNDYIAFSASPVTLDGNAYGATAVTIYNNGSPVPSSFAANYFNAVVTLVSGANNISIVAAGAGISETRQLTIYYGPAGPQVFNVTPADSGTVYSTSVTVNGSFREASSVSVNGVSVYSSTANTSGTFSRTFTLTGNQWNVITVVAANTSGGSTTHLFNVYCKTDPVINITSPTVGQVVYAHTVTVSGFVYNTVAGGLTVNGESTTFDSAGAFSRNMTLKPGSNTINVSARNSTGVTANSSVTVEYRGGPNIFNILPLDGAVTSSNITVSGKVVNTSANGLKTNNSVVSFDGSGNFNQALTLSPGNNTITLTATDGFTVTTKTINIRYDAGPVIVITSPANNEKVVRPAVTITGKVFNTEDNGLLINGETVPFNRTDGSFSKTIDLKRVENTIELNAYNGSLWTTKSLTVYYSGLPEISISSHSAGDTINTVEAIIEGSVFPDDPADIQTFTITPGDISDNKPKIANGFFRSFPVKLDESGEDTEVNITLTTRAITDSDGNTIASRTITRIIKLKYKNGPVITVVSPLDESTVYTNNITVRGTLKKADYSSFKINNTSVKVNSDGSFAKEITLTGGKNEIKLTAKLDKIGSSEETTNKTLTVYYNALATSGAKVRTKLEDGGEVKAFNDLVKIKLTKGSTGLNTTSELSVVDPSDIDDLPAQSAFVGPLVRLRWEGDEPIKPYKITLKYDGIVRENQAHKVSVFYFDWADDKWKILGGVYDAKSQTISVETDKGGYYAAVIYFRSFDDVTAHWAQRDIEFLVARGVVTGSSEHRFKPENGVTRAEFVTFLVKALGWQPYEPENASYSDVDEDHWGFKYIEAALRAGLVSGVSYRNFAPDRHITREEAGALLARAGNLKVPKDQEIVKVFSSFGDADRISTWAKNELAAAVKSKILNGSDNGMFHPNSYATRAQAAAMIARLSEVVNKTKTSAK